MHLRQAQPSPNPGLALAPWAPTMARLSSRHAYRTQPPRLSHRRRSARCRRAPHARFFTQRSFTNPATCHQSSRCTIFAMCMLLLMASLSACALSVPYDPTPVDSFGPALSNTSFGRIAHRVANSYNQGASATPCALAAHACACPTHSTALAGHTALTHSPAPQAAHESV